MYHLVLCYVVFMNILCDGSQIFHENTKRTFHHNIYSDYFGYSVLLTNHGLIVGAPKALSETKKDVHTGLVFNCSLQDMQPQNFCKPMKIAPEGKLMYKRTTRKDFFRDDMWFGATLAAIPNGKFMVCAPRWMDPFTDDRYMLATGACYVRTKLIDITLTPLLDENKQAFQTDGTRREYGEKGQHISYYAYAQFGMSVKVTENNTIVLGAPGLLHWTGGVLSYKFIRSETSVYYNKQTISNPYYTRNLEPDDYFGYSVESGIFKIGSPILHVAGAPRAGGYGQVLIFEPATQETNPLNIHAKIKGPHLGSYFGASLCCADIDGDGRSDLLVGAPNFVKQDGGLPYDQGAVFVYLTREVGSSFTLEASGHVTGSGESGARFGTSIAELGDVDGDGFTDIAIGAPWENGETGVVYIYRGDNKGLKSPYAQRIFGEKAQGFGMSISKGLDINYDNCNDLAIGAHKSGTAYIYRCVPSVKVRAYIKVPNSLNIPQNTSGFTAYFCISAAEKTSWPHAKLKLKARITVDPEGNRATISGDSVYPVTVKPGYEACDEQTVKVLPTADLSKPILLKFELEPDEILKEKSPIFMTNAARLSDDSNLKSSFLIQLVRDCGEDLICTPWLVVSLSSLSDPHIPGSGTRLGAVLTVFNKAEPAYAIQVHVTLPAHPLRIPNDCSLEDLNMTCDIPGPLLRDAQKQWDIELDYTIKGQNKMDLKMAARIEESLVNMNSSNIDDLTDEIELHLRNQANFTLKGKRKQNATLAVSREKFNKGENVTFVHYFEVLNSGPSDWFDLEAHLLLPDMVNLMSEINGCKMETYPIECVWSIPVNTTWPVVLPLSLDLSEHGNLLETNVTFNISTNLILDLEDRYESSTITTTLVLDPKPPIWPLIAGIIGGLLVLAAIIYILHKCGFFSRKQREQLKKLQGQDVQLGEQSCDPSASDPPTDAEGSSNELLPDGSD